MLGSRFPTMMSCLRLHTLLSITYSRPGAKAELTSMMMSPCKVVPGHVVGLQRAGRGIAGWQTVCMGFSTHPALQIREPSRVGQHCARSCGPGQVPLLSDGRPSGGERSRVTIGVWRLAYIHI